jgi:hypothetical protein
MNGYIANIEKLSLENENFRQVLYTDKNSQLVLMSLLPGEDIGEEILRKRFISDREARWQWDNVPLSGIYIPEKARSGCTSPTVVAPDAGVSPNRARRRAGGSGDYSGSVSTGRIFVPGCQCSGTVCDCR